MNFSSFDGLELDFNKDVMGSVKDSYGHEFEIKTDKSGSYSDRVRPVVYDQLVDCGRVIRPFDGTINVALKLKTASIDTDSLKVTIKKTLLQS